MKKSWLLLLLVILLESCWLGNLDKKNEDIKANKVSSNSVLEEVIDSNNTNAAQEVEKTINIDEEYCKIEDTQYEKGLERYIPIWINS